MTSTRNWQKYFLIYIKNRVSVASRVKFHIILWLISLAILIAAVFQK